MGRKKIWLMIILAPIFIAVYVWVVMLLWNWLIPDIAGFREINFWETLGIVFLAKLLFGFGGGYKKGHHNKEKWRKRMKHKFSNMSEDEKREFKENWRKRCRDGKYSKPKEVSGSPKSGDSDGLGSHDV